MTTPSRIVVDRQTARAEIDRLVAVARVEAQRQHELSLRLLRVTIVVLDMALSAAAGILTSGMLR